MEQRTGLRSNEAFEGLVPKVITKAGKIMPVPVIWNGKNESGWTPIDDKVLVLPDEIATETRGGIKLTEEMQERQQLAVEYGTIVAVGAAAFALSGDRVRHWTEGPKPQPGDRVMIERYAGQLLHGDDGRTYRLCDDKCIGAVKIRAQTETISE